MDTHRSAPCLLHYACLVAVLLLFAWPGMTGCTPSDDAETATVEPSTSVSVPKPEAPAERVQGVGLKAIQVKELIDEERYDEAEALLQSLLAEHPGDPALTIDLAVVYQRTGRAVEALGLLQEGLKREPDNHRFHMDLGRSYAGQGEFEQALEHLNRALEIKPGLASVYELRGMCLMELDRWLEARTAFQAALSYDESLPVSLVSLAFLEANGGNWDVVIDLTGRAIAIDSEISRAYVLRGWALAERGEFDEAERTLARAAELEPGDQQLVAIRARVAQMKSAPP